MAQRTHVATGSGADFTAPAFMGLCVVDGSTALSGERDDPALDAVDDGAPVAVDDDDDDDVPAVDVDGAAEPVGAVAAAAVGAEEPVGAAAGAAAAAGAPGAPPAATAASIRVAHGSHTASHLLAAQRRFAGLVLQLLHMTTGGSGLAAGLAAVTPPPVVALTDSRHSQQAQSVSIVSRHSQQAPAQHRCDVPGWSRIRCRRSCRRGSTLTVFFCLCFSPLLFLLLRWGEGREQNGRRKDETVRNYHRPKTRLVPNALP